SGPTEVVPVDITANGRPAVTLAPNTFVNLPSHLGIPPAWMLTLGCIAYPAQNTTPTHTPCFQMLPDGTQAATEFAIPAGYDLVLTDASWMAQTGNPGHSALFAIAGGSATSPTAAYHQSPALVDVDGRAGDNVTFSGGLRFNKMPIFIINPLQDELFVRAYIVPSS